MPACKPYRNIPVADLPDADWVAVQSVPADARNVYTMWPGRNSIEVTVVWWDAVTNTPVYDAVDVELQPVEIKRTDADTFLAIPASITVVNATRKQTGPAFEKQSLTDTSPDEIYWRVAAATAPVGATHLRLLVEVTP